VKILDGGINLFSDVIKCREKYGLDKMLFEIQRHGAAGDPKTTYSVLPEGPIGEQLAQEVARHRLHDLYATLSTEGEREAANDNRRAVAVVAPLRPEHGQRPPLTTASTATEPLVDTDVASALAARLKVLPREAVEQFLQTFGVRRLRELRASQEAAAREVVERLERPAREPGEDDDGEIDPFGG
jgi:hypothetical protein